MRDFSAGNRNMMDHILTLLSIATCASTERVFIGGGGGREDDNKPPSLASQQELALGDHVVLLRTYQAWARGGHRRVRTDG